MDGMDQTLLRDANGRFLPGQSGNPGGKKPGTRNRATLLRAALCEGEDKTVARIVINRAKAGDAVAARFILGMLCPRPRGRAIELDLPKGAGAGDVLAVFDATVRAMAAGEITPDEAVSITRVLEGRLKAVKAWRRERADEDEDSTLANVPAGRQGEGVRPISNADGKASSPTPHPARSPGGERVALEIRNDADLLHSACISRQSGFRTRRAA
jgi:hypothetical protein